MILLAAFLFTVYSWYGMTELYAEKIEEKRGLELMLAHRKSVESRHLKITAPLEDYKVTSACGLRTNPMGGGEERFHRGLDMVGPLRGNVLAAADGMVMEHWPPPGSWYRGHPVYGGMLIIDHGGGIYTLYGHMRSMTVKKGDRVIKGQRIGLQGNTGISNGEHLHFEVIVDPAMALESLLLRTEEVR